MKRFIFAVTLSLLVLLVMLVGCARSESIFPDENLEAAIRDALDKPVGEEITVDELANLTTLSAEGNLITDLSGLEYCTNLESLGLGNNNISDISALVANSGLWAGDTVWLQDNPLSTTSLDVYIPQLEARGVDVTY